MHTTHSRERGETQCPINRTLHQVVDRWTEHALKRVGRLGLAEPVWSYLRLQRPIQRWRKEEKQLLENSVASAVFSRALNNTNIHGYSNHPLPQQTHTVKVRPRLKQNN